ncbi:hypothetical protein FPZ43_07975 [Mucilaginibacter pallidiroseus]|uniref:HMA domain-containing protein n=1 Tax=Mucilaginibacter pallidiroseus TaxID=2599295 RepID=A0A563UEJ9_9SPHI|nr:hypothetical protein [Mucilaginibacter pallidiroseus]TWR29784.1 hypothetical protein FPZ43_07975 [Mucilaginibacter pallidiroseus]
MTTTVAVFKTNVKRRAQADRLLSLLNQSNPGCRINFDLDDCDKILRVEGNTLCCNKLIQLLKFNGHACEVLT